jgi:hypothetical protein
VPQEDKFADALQRRNSRIRRHQSKRSTISLENPEDNCASSLAVQKSEENDPRQPLVDPGEKTSCEDAEKPTWDVGKLHNENELSEGKALDSTVPSVQVKGEEETYVRLFSAGSSSPMAPEAERKNCAPEGNAEVAGVKDEVKDESCTNAIGRVAKEDIAMQFAVHSCPPIVSEINSNRSSD